MKKKGGSKPGNRANTKKRWDVSKLYEKHEDAQSGEKSRGGMGLTHWWTKYEPGGGGGRERLTNRIGLGPTH